MAVSDIVTMGFGSFSSVNRIPTLGYAGVAVVSVVGQSVEVFEATKRGQVYEPSCRGEVFESTPRGEVWEPKR